MTYHDTTYTVADACDLLIIALTRTSTLTAERKATAQKLRALAATPGALSRADAERAYELADALEHGTPGYKVVEI